MNYVRHLHKRLKHSLLSLLAGVLTQGPISTVLVDDIYQQEDVMKIAADAGLWLMIFTSLRLTSSSNANTGAYIVRRQYRHGPGTQEALAKPHECPIVWPLKKARSSTIPWSATEADQAISENNLLSNSPIVAGVDYKVSELTDALFVPSSSAAVIMLNNAVTDRSR